MKSRKRKKNYTSVNDKVRPRSISMINDINIIITLLLISFNISKVRAYELRKDIVFCDTKEGTSGFK